MVPAEPPPLPGIQASQPSDTPPSRPRVALVLSGGGARGFAHVGVLKALEAARVPVDWVVGTSMGAIVGGLYASGMTLQALEQELMAIDWTGLFERDAPRQTLSQRRKEEDYELSPVLQLGYRNGEFRLPTGAVSTRSLEWLLRRYTLPTRHLPNFDALPTPFRAVATDMETGEAVVMDRGDLAAALRASMSVPGVFSPLEIDGRLLGDGGLVNNLPVDVARQLGADAVIAVNIGTPLAGRDTLGSVLGISAQMINILTEQNVQRSVANLTRHDLLLTPPLNKVWSADFDKASEIVAIGDAYAQTVTASLERFSVSEAAYAAWRLERQPMTEPVPRSLAFVRIEGVEPGRAHHLERQIDTQPGKPLDMDTLESDLRQLSGSRDYERIDYRLSPDEKTLSEGLVIGLQENSLGRNFFRVGLDLNTDFQGESAFDLRINHNRHWLTASGMEWRNQITLGGTTGMRSELFYPWGGARDRFLLGYVGIHRTKVELFNASGQAQALIGRGTATLGIDHGWTSGKGGRLGDFRLGVFVTRRSIDPELIGKGERAAYARQHWTDRGVRGTLVSDQLDHANFPRQGYRHSAVVEAGHRQGSGLDTGFVRLDMNGTRVFSWGPHTLNLHGRVARVTNAPAAAVDEYALGGFHQLSGYQVGQVAGNYMALLRLGYYQRLALNPGVVTRALFAGGTIEAGNAWSSVHDVRTHGVKTGFSLYLGADTALGPVYLSLVHAPRQSTGLYFFLGRP